ncbi:MAG: hypothetical protein HN337_04415 [Deltaproteobacteria bacterium]|nr:hypothetical protein [Deltaproteobacteria bacterium]
MIGLIGIMGCITAVAGIIAGAAAIATAIISGVSSAQQKAAAADNANMQREAMANAESRGRYQKRMNEKSQMRGALKMKAQMGSSIALDHLYSKKLKGQNGRKRADLNMAKAQTNVKSDVPRPVRNMGKPQAQLEGQ